MEQGHCSNGMLCVDLEEFIPSFRTNPLQVETKGPPLELIRWGTGASVAV